MSDEYTPNLNLTKPDVGASDDTWGEKLNDNFDKLDLAFGSPVTIPPEYVTDSELTVILDGYISDSELATILNGYVTNGEFNEKTDDRVAALLVAGANITLNYNDAANTLTITSTAAGGGGGDVVGPAGAVADNIAVFNGATGKLIKDGGAKVTDFAPIGSIVVPATAVPLVESGTGAVGTSAKYAREDHVHPLGPGGGGGTSVVISDTAPVGQPAGTLWWESDSGSLYVNYNDGTSTQWVLVQAPAVSSSTPDIPSNVGLSVSAAAGALTINLTDAAGATPSPSSPVRIPFRSVTPGLGVTSVLSVTAASSIVLVAGWVLDVTANTGFRLWVTGWNDGGTFRLGIFKASNLSNIFPLNEAGIATSIAVGGGLGNSGQHYTAGGVVTSKAFRILGYIDWTSAGIAVPGTWTITNLNSIQIFGPGVKKPGDILQAIRGVATVTMANSTTAYVVTNLSAVITPQSAANLVEWSFAGLATASNGTQTTPLVQMFRSNNSSPAVTNALGPVVFQTNQNNAAAQAWWLAAASDLDAPNKEVPIAYTVGLRSSAAFQVNFPEIGNGQRGVMVLKELMG